MQMQLEPLPIFEPLDPLTHRLDLHFKFVGDGFDFGQAPNASGAQIMDAKAVGIAVGKGKKNGCVPALLHKVEADIGTFEKLDDDDTVGFDGTISTNMDMSMDMDLDMDTDMGMNGGGGRDEDVGAGGLWKPFAIPRLPEKPQNPIIARIEGGGGDLGKERRVEVEEKRMRGIPLLIEPEPEAGHMGLDLDLDLDLGEREEEAVRRDGDGDREVEGDVWLEAVGRYVEYKVR